MVVLFKAVICGDGITLFWGLIYPLLLKTVSLVATSC